MVLIKKAAGEVVTSFGFLKSCSHESLNLPTFEAYILSYLKGYGIQCTHEEKEKLFLLSYNKIAGPNIRYKETNGIVEEVRISYPVEKPKANFS